MEVRLDGTSAPAPEFDIVYYDGGCALCHGTVRFFLRRDPWGERFRFAPLDGETFRQQVRGTDPASLPDSVVVCTTDGRLLLRSEAVVYLLGRLGPPWHRTGRGLSLIPRPLRNGGYAIVARLRRILFGRPKDGCPVPPGPLRSRFLE
jgi:predicted DCC family thiol-disulfide oxidoreductase YuxK